MRHGTEHAKAALQRYQQVTGTMDREMIEFSQTCRCGTGMLRLCSDLLTSSLYAVIAFWGQLSRKSVTMPIQSEGSLNASGLKDSNWAPAA